MERPRWAPIIFSGAVPSEASDLVSITIIGLASTQVALSQLNPFSSLENGWILLVLVPLTCVLAALSNSANREREELALFAYGGSSTQIGVRYFLRGSVMAAVGLVPLLAKFLIATLQFSTGLVMITVLAVIGGLSYASPILKRTRSSEFLEQYKG